jgi:hypothetical protein
MVTVEDRLLEIRRGARQRAETGVQTGSEFLDGPAGVAALVEDRLYVPDVLRRGVSSSAIPSVSASIWRKFIRRSAPGARFYGQPPGLEAKLEGVEKALGAGVGHDLPHPEALAVGGQDERELMERGRRCGAGRPGPWEQA